MARGSFLAKTVGILTGQLRGRARGADAGVGGFSINLSVFSADLSNVLFTSFTCLAVVRLVMLS